MSNENSPSDADVYSRVVTSCTNANLRNTARVVTQLYDEFLEPSGLLGTQFRLLGAVAANGSVALTPLAEMLSLDPTTLARNLKPLERDGLVEISVGEEDRRMRVVTLTDEGQDALAKAMPMWEAAQAWIIDRLGEERWQALLADWAELVALINER